MDAGYGLAVRWSLKEAPSGVAGQLREYVLGTSLARFMFLDGLSCKLWRMVEGDWFEGTYVFATAADRDAFRSDFEVGALASPVSKLVGSGEVPPRRGPGQRRVVRPTRAQMPRTQMARAQVARLDVPRAGARGPVAVVPTVVGSHVRPGRWLSA